MRWISYRKILDANFWIKDLLTLQYINDIFILNE